jgi:hypothetical protein
MVYDAFGMAIEISHTNHKPKHHEKHTTSLWHNGAVGSLWWR